ncbi:MAG: hypothetical protein IJB13_00715 [Clostridia bacterium]|nr:hypothetical protein [Clostridia bacterium]
MMRKTGKLFLISGMIICILLGTGCTKKGSPIKIKVESNEVYAIDEPIELSLKIGHSYSFESDEGRIGKSIAIVKISHAGYKDDSMIVPESLVNGETLLEIRDFLTTKYRLTTYDVGNCSAFRFNNSVKIIIPQKYIVKDKGTMMLEFICHYLDNNGNIKEGGKGVVVFITYCILDGKINLEVENT